MTASSQHRYMTADEYLEWESRQEIRHEYCKGEIFAISGGTKNHAEYGDFDMTGSELQATAKKWQQEMYSAWLTALGLEYELVSLSEKEMESLAH